MRVLICLGLLLFSSLASAADKPNVLLICVDDLRPELACFGKEYIHSPNIDALAERGRIFGQHYVQAPTCGASRYALLTGTYGPSSNGALFSRAAQMEKSPEAVLPSMPAWFRKHGYTTVSVGKVSHHPGGRGGGDWDDDAQPEMPDSWDRHLMPVGRWMHPRGAMHGLAHGEIRGNASKMAVYQSTPGKDDIYPDGLTTETAITELKTLTDSSDKNPFFLAVGIIRPHLPFGAPAKYMVHYENATLPAIPHPEKPSGQTTWHGSGEFMKYNRWGRNPNIDPEFATLVRKHYAACVTYADAQVGRIIAALDKSGQRDNTIIVIWGDHGWHLGEHAIWGKHALFEESLHSPLIICHPEVKQPGKTTSAIVESIDIFPTLCDLADVPKLESIDGISLIAHLGTPDVKGGTAVSYSRAQTIRSANHRLILHRNGHVELYDHTTPEGETKNIAGQNEKLVESLTAELKRALEK